MRAAARALTIFEKLIHHGRWWHALLIFLTLTILGIALRWVLQTQALKRRHAQLQAAEQPFTSEELDTYYAIPEGSLDTTDLWLEALRLANENESYDEEEGLPIVGFVDSPELPPIGKPWPEKDAVTAFLERQAQPLAAIHRAATADGVVRFPHDLGPDGDVISELTDLFMTLRRCERLLRLQAYARSSEGDIEGSVTSLREIFAVGKALEGYPLAVAFLVRTAISGSAAHACTQLLPFIHPSTDDLKSVQTELRRLDYRRDLYRAIVGERVFWLDNCAYYIPDTTFLPMPEEALWYFEPGVQLRILADLDGLAEQAYEPWPTALSHVEKLKKRKPRSWSLTDPVVSESMPVLAGLFYRAAHADALAASLDAAIASELFRRDSRRWPRNLGELVPDYLPDVPGDPFTGQPLRYVAKDDELLIYSVGEDSVDNQGHVSYEDEVEPLDVGVRWPLTNATFTAQEEDEQFNNQEGGNHEQ